MTATITPLGIEGGFLIEPTVHGDARGSFTETFKASDFAAAIGRPLVVAQVNVSRSVRGTLRGVHYADLPPSQAKYVMCSEGEILDVVVDIRVGSPTFGTHVAVPLDATSRAGVFLSEGLGHAFLALSETAVVTYLVTAEFAPTREHGITPVDDTLAIDWPSGITPLMSAKDAAAPSLAEARDQGLLPDYAACCAYVASLGR